MRRTLLLFSPSILLTCKAVVQAAFVAEDVSSIIKESIDGVLQSQQFNAQKVRHALMLVKLNVLYCTVFESTVHRPHLILACIGHYPKFLGLMQVGQWTTLCLESCMKRLTLLNKPFKYIVTCVIMQKNGEPTTLAVSRFAADCHANQ